MYGPSKHLQVWLKPELSEPWSVGHDNDLRKSFEDDGGSLWGHEVGKKESGSEGGAEQGLCVPREEKIVQEEVVGQAQKSGVWRSMRKTTFSLNGNIDKSFFL